MFKLKLILVAAAGALAISAAGAASAQVATASGSARILYAGEQGFNVTSSDSINRDATHSHSLYSSPSSPTRAQVDVAAKVNVKNKTIGAFAGATVTTERTVNLSTSLQASATAELKDYIWFGSGKYNNGEELFVKFKPVRVQGRVFLDESTSDADWRASSFFSYGLVVGDYDTSLSASVSGADSAANRLKEYDKLKLHVNDGAPIRVQAGVATLLHSSITSVASIVTYDPLKGGRMGPGQIMTLANFGNTVYWGGVESVTLADGTPVDDWYVGSDAGIDWATASAGAAVPEPASWALMIAGFGLVGAALRRRHAGSPSFA